MREAQQGVSVSLPQSCFCIGITLNKSWFEEDKLGRLAPEGVMPKLIVKIGVKKQLLLPAKLQQNGEVVLCNSISLLLLLNENFSNKRKIQWLKKITQLLQQFSLLWPLQLLLLGNVYNRLPTTRHLTWT
jgi:hypothetical protein